MRDETNPRKMKPVGHETWLASIENPDSYTGPRQIEAFCLMIYRCKACKYIELLWNSRDGVTPFSISCGSARCPSNLRDGGPADLSLSAISPMFHEVWYADVCAPNFVPVVDMRIFVGPPDKPDIVRVDYDYIERWVREQARALIEREENDAGNEGSRNGSTIPDA